MNGVVLKCTGCGTEFYRKKSQALLRRRDKKVESIPSRYNFHSVECMWAYQRKNAGPHASGNGDNDKYRAWLEGEGKWVLYQHRQKAVEATRFYTPSLLRSMLEYAGDDCSVPGCMARQSRMGSQSIWHTCPKHTKSVSLALWKADKRRKKVLSQFGLEPI